jgi:hypothetical protein
MTEVAGTGRRALPASKEVRALSRDFKQGYHWQPTGGGHWRLLDRSGAYVEHEGTVITVGDKPSPGVVRALKDELTEARVLKGTDPRPMNEEVKAKRTATYRALNEARDRRRQEIATERLRRLREVLKPIGIETPGIAPDLGWVGQVIARESFQRELSHDLVTQNARRVLSGGWTEDRYGEVWDAMLDRLERAPDVVGEWFNLIREAKGLPADHVEVKLPKGAQDDWPFDVKLLPLEALFADDQYQRPVNWPFVRKEAARFDPSLVGTIDVAQRGPSQFAILDGQQRREIVRMAGKTSIFASVYVGLDLASEARFFLHKNRDRKTVHPYYTYVARLTARDPEALAVEAIVRKHGYQVAIGAPREGSHDNIAAIAALESAYRRKREDGSDALTPTLATMREGTYGRQLGNSAALIHGLSILYSENGQLEQERMIDVLLRLGPELAVGRARDLHRNSGGSIQQRMADVLRAEYGRKGKGRKAAA